MSNHKTTIKSLHTNKMLGKAVKDKSQAHVPMDKPQTHVSMDKPQTHVPMTRKVEPYARAITASCNEISQTLLQNLVSNINMSFDQNSAVARDYLKCRTAPDLIDIQCKFFESNFSILIKTYLDLAHDMTQLNEQYAINLCGSRG